MKIRMHPSIILENLISSIGFIIIIFIYILFNALENNKNLEELYKLANDIPFIGVLIAILIFLILLIIFTIIFAFKWYNTYIFINKDNFIIESGKLFKKKITYHFKDIASINIKQNILEKIFKTANFKIVLNTNEDAGNQKKLVFKYDKAQNLKNQILKKEEENDDFQSLINFDFVDILKHILLNANIGTCLIVLIIYIPVLLTFFNDINGQSILMIIILSFVFLAGIVSSIIKTILNYFNFKINREKDNIKLSHGLLTTYKYNLPVNKINAVIIKRTLQAKIFDYYLVEVVNAGMNDNEKEKTIISLYVKKNKLNLIFEQIIPEYQNDITLTKQESNAFITYLLAKSLWLIPIILTVNFTHLLSLLLIPLLVLISFIQYKVKMLGTDNTYLIYSAGLFENKTVITNYKKIELLSFKKSIASSLTKLWQVKFNIVGNLTNNSFTSGYFPKEVMQEIEKAY